MLNAKLAWLGGGEPREVGDSHEKSNYALAGVIVAVNAVLACLVAVAVIAASTHWPYLVIVPLGLVFGVLVGAVTRAIATGDTRTRRGLAGRVAVGIAVGAVVGELAAILLFSGGIDRRIDEQSLMSLGVVQASADVDQAHQARAAADTSVEQARDRRDEALVVARCEYNPSPACPQTRITGVPGTGPETRTANELLAAAQQELDNALADRDRRSGELDTVLADANNHLAQARTTAVADADRGLGARWVAMNGYTLSNVGALLLRFAVIGFFGLLTLLPLILRRWRGETTQDRVLAARAERERADLEADTAISIKQAEVRASAETLWAEQQLTNARFAVQAQTEIDREHHRRRVEDAIGAAVPPVTTVEDDMYLPIAAEAEAASRAAAELPAAEAKTLPAAEAKTLPAPVPPARERGSVIPTIPEVTKAAARWVRPLVPPIITRAIDTTTQPLRAARQAFEEVEEITFSFKRVHKVTLHSEESAPASADVATSTPAASREQTAAQRVEAEFDRPRGTADFGAGASLGRVAADPRHGLTGRDQQSELGAGTGRRELRERKGPQELPERKGPRELPPAE